MKSDVLLTIFTPTYNRAYCLKRCYESMLRQKCKAFLWMIVDDGSTDNTRELVEAWQKECTEFEIRYIYKENGGLYTGYNCAIENGDTELIMCIDSDDWLTDNAVDVIKSFWEENGSNEYAGILGLDCKENGEIIGDLLPNQKSINRIALYRGKYHIKDGDRKEVFRTDLYREIGPIEEIPGEKDYNPFFLHLEIARKYDMLVLNERLCVVDYQIDGMTNTVFKQYLRSPKSFRKMRLEDMQLPYMDIRHLLKTCVHYTSSCIISGEPCISASPHKAITLLIWPFGLLWTCYLYMYNLLSKK